MKLDKTGNILWIKKSIETPGFLYPLMYRDVTQKFIEVDGGSLIGINYEDDDNGRMMYFTKIDNEGNTIFAKTMDTSTLHTWHTEIFKTDDNGYLLTSRIYREDESIVLIKLNEDFEIEGQIKYIADDLASENKINYVLQNGETYLLSGTTEQSTSESNSFLLKISNTGNILWQKNFDSNTILVPSHIDDSGFMLSGSSDTDIYLANLNSEGDFNWCNMYGIPTEPDVTGISAGLLPTKTDGYTISGSRKRQYVDPEGTHNTNVDVILMKTDSYGNIPNATSELVITSIAPEDIHSGIDESILFTLESMGNLGVEDSVSLNMTTVNPDTITITDALTEWVEHMEIINLSE